MTDKQQRFRQAEQRGYVLRQHWLDSHLLNALMEILGYDDPLRQEMCDLAKDYDADASFPESCAWLRRLDVVRAAARKKVC